MNDGNGVWTGESAPQDEGFHYYQLNIDGASVPDPGSLYFYGAGRWGSGIEIPAADEDFYALKNVPQGQMREMYYYSEVNDAMRHCFSRPAGSRGAGNGLPSNWADNFMNTLIKDIIPMIDSNFRTIADREHRAMAGLSMGGMQTRAITLAHPEMFSSLGIFSGGTITLDEAEKSEGFIEGNDLVFVSYGSREVENRRQGDPADDVAELKAAGLNAHYYVSPQTAHEWQSWRRSLYQFAQLLWK